MPTKPIPPPPVVRQTPGTLLFGFLACVVVPAFVTVIAPVSYLRLEKSAAGARASVKTCLFFIVPFSRGSLDSIQSVSREVREDRDYTLEERRRRDGKHGTVEGEGKLILQGKDEGAALTVSVSPASIEGVEKRVKEFVAAPVDQPLSLFLVPNWKFSLIAGGLATALAGLWLVGTTLWILRGLLRLVSPGKSIRG